jgi:hypothetical protein
MSTGAECCSLIWEKMEQSFILFREQVPYGSMLSSPSGQDFEVGTYRFRIVKKGFIKPRLTLLDMQERELGRVLRYGGFEPRIELMGDHCFLHRELREGQMNHAIFNCQGDLVLETQDTSIWNSPSMRMNFFKSEMPVEQCAHLAAIALFMFLDRRQGMFLPGDGIP